MGRANLPLIPWLRVALVVEDHGPLANRLASWLRRWGAQEVRVASTIATACAAMRELGTSLDLLLCDVYLQDGRCDAAIAEAHRFVPQACVVLLTGRASQQERTDLVYDLQPQAFVSKPLTPQLLHDRLITRDRTLGTQAVGWTYKLALAKGLRSTRGVRPALLKRLVADARGNVSEAARRVHMNRTHLHKLLAERRGADPTMLADDANTEKRASLRLGPASTARRHVPGEGKSGERAVSPALREQDVKTAKGH